MIKTGNKEKEFLDIFQQMCYSRSSWQVWADLMTAIACTLANSVDKTLPRYTTREKEYAECIDRLGGVDKPAKCFAIIVEALDQIPEQDFLGRLYMNLGLGNHWKGQFFTPYPVCECMAEITINDNIKNLEKKEWISVNDPACGAGATLVATANIFRKKKDKLPDAGAVYGERHRSGGCSDVLHTAFASWMCRLGGCCEHHFKSGLW